MPTCLKFHLGPVMALLIHPVGGFAQGLGLDELIQLGLEKNGELSVHRQELQSTRLDSLAAASRLNPHLEVEALHNLAHPNQPQASVRLSQEFAPKLRGRKTAAARAETAAGQEQLRVREQEWEESLRTAFAEWQILDRKAALQRDMLDRWEKLDKVAANQLAQGRLSEVDRTEAQLNALQGRQRELSLLAERDSKERSIQNLVGQLARPKALDPEQFDALPLLPTLDSLLAWTDLANAALVARRKEADATRSHLQVEEGSAFTGFNLSVGYEKDPEGHQLIGGGIEMPLPFANRNQAGIQKARSRIREAELRIATARTAVQTEVTDLHGRLLRHAERHLHFKTHIRDLLRKQLGLAEKGFREGLLGVFDLSRVQSEYLRREEEALDILHDHYHDWNRLRHLVGGRI